MGRVRVDLAFASRGRWALLDELNGAVEASVQGTGTLETVGLLDQLLVRTPQAAAGPGDASTLTACDRDRLLGALYIAAYGPVVDVTVNCAACTSPFDLDFSLPDLMASLATTPPEGFDDDGRPLFKAPDGTLFRLPTGADECALAGMNKDAAVRALLDMCIVEDCPALTDSDALQQAMASVAPMVDLDLPVTCPECGSEQEFRFDLQHYAMSTLVRDRPLVAAEVHTLATAYGWGYGEIIGMPRSLRKTFVGIVDGTIPRWRA